MDPDLLAGARAVRPGASDASMLDQALRALLDLHRSAQVDASYAVYDEHPLEEADEWGDLASWRQAVGRS